MFRGALEHLVVAEGELGNVDPGPDLRHMTTDLPVREGRLRGGPYWAGGRGCRGPVDGVPGPPNEWHSEGDTLA